MCNVRNDKCLEYAENVSNISSCHFPLIPSLSGGVDVKTFRQLHSRTEHMHATGVLLQQVDALVLRRMCALRTIMLPKPKNVAPLVVTK